MRWFVAAVLAVVAAWMVYLGSPYWALYRLAAAVEAGDVAEAAKRINTRALRSSLARALAADLTTPEAGIATQDAQLAATAALALADPFLEALVSPAGMSRLLLTGPSGSADGAPLGGDPVSWEDLDDFLSASSWRGFRNVYVSLPQSEPAASRYRLQMRFGRLRWRLVSIELPPEARRRLAAELMRHRAR